MAAEDAKEAFEDKGAVNSNPVLLLAVLAANEAYSSWIKGVQEFRTGFVTYLFPAQALETQIFCMLLTIQRRSSSEKPAR